MLDKLFYKFFSCLDIFCQSIDRLFERRKNAKSILDALRAKYEAEIAEADATANIYLDNSVGIGEHPQHIEEVNKQIEKIANAKEKLAVLEEFEPERSVL